MEIMNISELYYLSFNITNINVKSQSWKNGDTFDWTKDKRIRSGIMYFKDCDGVFYLKNGHSVTAQKGSLAFLSKDTNYSITFNNVTDCIRRSYLINFILTDDNGMEFAFSDKPIVLPIKANDEIILHFEQLVEYYKSAFCSPMKLKADVNRLIFAILSSMRYTHHESKDVQNIAAGIKYMEDNLCQNISVEQLAKMCCVSTSCFIRAFKKYSGLTPKEYLLNLKIEKAKDMLSSNMFSVNEIADFLGFSSPAYFSYIFKKKTSMSPTDYKDKDCSLNGI